MAKVVIGIGGNLGDTRSVFRETLTLLSDYISNMVVSSLYSTKSLLRDEQPDYLNIVVVGDTDLEPESLLSNLQNSEKKIGKVKIGHWQERLIDLDIIDYDNLIIDTLDLTIPHTQMQFRSFVLLPLKEVYPNYVHPILKSSISELIDNIDDCLEIINLGMLQK